jgi:predicted DNA-binding transcriptional regulator AlpA
LQIEQKTGSDFSNEVYLSSKQLRARYGGVSDMWIYRRLQDDPSFPRPMKIKRLRFWREADLVTYERSKARESTPQGSSRPGVA